ncbi:hypothetical protein [Micromonospora sp. L32]|uniref:hypothetical protein n=1 Tax=Micromonospora sp. L32 TaxID=3452214 RepID=UPI003F8C4DB7
MESSLSEWRDVPDLSDRNCTPRGRICRCLPGEPDLDDGSSLLPERHEEGWTVVVIVSGLATETDRGVRHVNISVTAGIPTQDSGDVQGTSEPTSSTGGEPDIVLDYRDPHGPLIRYLAPHLSPDGQR